MDNRRYTFRTATITFFLVGPWISTFLLLGLWIGIPFPSAKASPGLVGIAPEKVADYIHTVIEADRSIYTVQIVNRMQEKGIVAATEHWEQDNAIPLPAQFLQHSGRLVAERGRGIRYRLIGLSPMYQRNGPATEFERKALTELQRHPDRPVTGIVSSGKKQYFQAIYSDRAVSSACVTCHNGHPLSPKRDFQLNDVMGGIAITIPLE
ncbi:MAG: hypothetical protein CV081_10605 [Nitrospira sp. LK265]|nr:DUF3365 domain-containing protein [Nitrospira sp.]NGZ60936.1 hypothetical protein [Nitrospira sp. LK265]